MRNAPTNGNPSDAALDALWEARERDELPEEPPMTDEEMERMAEYFAAQPARLGGGAS